MKTTANAMQWHIQQNIKKWLEFRDTPAWCEFVEALDEEQRERVGKYFGRAVKTMHLGAVAEGLEAEVAGLEGRKGLGKLAAAMKRDIFK